MDDTKLTPEQRAEGLRRYYIGRSAGKAALKLRTDNLAETYGLSSPAIDRIAGKGIKYAHSSRAYQDVPSEAINALWADITERDRLRSIKSANSTIAIARDLGVDEMKLRSQCEYHAKRQAGRTPIAERKPETPDCVRWFLTMPSASSAPFMGYY